MKFRENQPVHRRPKAVTALGMEESAESSLNEKIKLPPDLNQFMREKLRTHFSELQFMAEQLETVVGLITLFPNEAKYFKQQVRIDLGLKAFKKIPDVERGPRKEIMYRGLTVLAQLAPEQLPRFSPELGTEQLDLLGSIKYKPIKIERAAQLIFIFPERKEEILQAVQAELRHFGSSDNDEFWKRDDETGLPLMRDLMWLDPGLHPRLHEFASHHQTELEELFEMIKNGGRLSGARNIAVWYSVRKLLMAEEITQTPTGILLAVKKPKLSGGRPLPDRSLAV